MHGNTAMDRQQLIGRLQGGLFLSSMMGRTDGAFAARHGRGASMVQIGALVADAMDRSHEQRYLLPEARADMVPILRKEVQNVRAALGDVPIALNAAVGDLESGARMARAFHEAGGDIFELNVHGGYEKLLRRGLLRAMALPQNRRTMVQWLEELCRLDVPVVVKFRAGADDVDFAEVLRELGSVQRLFGVHFNVRAEGPARPDIEFVRTIRPHVRGQLWCSGHVRTRTHVVALLSAGADCVGIAQGVLDQPDIIARLRAQVRRDGRIAS